MCSAPASTRRERGTRTKPAESYPSRAIAQCYSTRRDLRWGVRIAAAYNDGRTMLYCVPFDTFGRMKSIRTGIDVWDERAGVIGQTDLLMDGFMRGDPHRGNATAGSCAVMRWLCTQKVQPTPQNHDRFHSVVLRKEEVTWEMVQDIAVSDLGGLKVWIFMQNGLVRIWALFSKVSLPSRQEERWIVRNDGVVMNKGEARDYEKSRSANSIALGSGMKRKGKARAKREGKEEEDGLFGSWLLL